MKVLNLTDIGTKALVQAKLVSHTFAVGPSLIAPGESAEVPQALAARILPEVQKLVTLGALAVNTLPPAYVTAKATQSRIEGRPQMSEPSTANLRRPKLPE